MLQLSALRTALLLAAALALLLCTDAGDANMIPAASHDLMPFGDDSTHAHPQQPHQPQLVKPLLEILHPYNDMLLSTTELQIDLVVRDELAGGFVEPKLCISMDPVFIPADVELEDGWSQLRETCFDHTVNGTTFHVEGLVPGLAYAIKAGLITHARVLSISMRTFEVASLQLAALGPQRMGIAMALETAVELHNAGDRQQAATIYRAILALFPNHAHTLHLLGLVRYQDGQPHDGLELIERALALNATDNAFHNAHGLCLQAMSRERDAIQSFRRALELRPFFYQAALNLGDALQSIGKWDDALHEYRKIAAAATHAYALADDAFARDATVRVCELVRISDGARDCNTCLVDAIKRWPHEPAFHVDRGHLLVGAKQLEQALTEFQTAAKMGSIVAMIDVAETLEALGETQECLHQYQLISMTMTPEHQLLETRVRMMRATVLPMVLPQTNELLTFYRNRFATELDALQSDLTRLRLTEVDPSRIPFSTALTLHAHNQNNRALRTKLSALYVALLFAQQQQPRAIVQERYRPTHRTIASPYRLILSRPTDPPPIAQRRLRVGFVGRHLADARAGLYVSDLIRQLSPYKYETFAFILGHSSSVKTKARIDQIATQVCALPDDLVTARDEIVAANIDVLIFPEVGIDRLTYFLSLARLAPVQAAWLGNPDTSGVATIDYRLVSEHEHANYRAHYSEQTYQIKGLGLYHSFPEPHDYIASRTNVRNAIIERFGLPQDFRMYFSLESILHIHPDFDRAVGQIFEQDPHARLFLLGRSARNRWRDQLVGRIYANAGNDVVADRIYFLNDVDAKQELLLAGAADAVLASVHTTSLRPTLQAFTAGVPVVTLRGELWSTRAAFALYQQMDMPEMVATSIDAYVALALRLARDSAFRAAIVTKLHDRRSRLHEDPQAIVEWESFFDLAGAAIYATDSDEEEDAKCSSNSTNNANDSKASNEEDATMRRSTAVVAVDQVAPLCPIEDVPASSEREDSDSDQEVNSDSVRDEL